MNEKITQYAALDENNVVIGIFAVNANDPQLPGVEHNELIPFPDIPQPTGKFVIDCGNSLDPNEECKEIELIEWPTQGWLYLDNKWVCPDI